MYIYTGRKDDQHLTRQSSPLQSHDFHHRKKGVHIHYERIFWNSHFKGSKRHKTCSNITIQRVFQLIIIIIMDIEADPWSSDHGLNIEYFI